VNNGLKSHIFILFQGRYPSEMAASLFATKNSESFGREGFSVTLLAPRRRQRVKESPFLYYGVEKNYRVKFLPTLDFFGIPVLDRSAFLVNHIAFGVSCFFFLLFNATGEDVVYSNETIPLLFSLPLFKYSLYEVHDFPEKHSLMYKTLFRFVRSILVTNNWKKNELEEKFPEVYGKTFYEPNAVDVEKFNTSLSKKEARRNLGLPEEKNILVYTGHLYPWKGVTTLCEAVKDMTLPVELFCVGGRATDVEEYRKRFLENKNIHFVGQRNHAEIPTWQKAANVLVLPNTAKEKISKYYTSPMKLFEYMASGRPIVASDLPSIREIANEENVFFAKPDDPNSFSEVITQALKEEKLSEEKAEKAFQTVRDHTWGARAKRILDVVLG